MTEQLSRADATLAPVRWPAAVTHVTSGADEDPFCGSWSPALSPDGRRMAYVSDRSGAPRVWLDDAALETGPHPVVRVTWSPDGAWLACEISPDGAPKVEVWLVRPDGSDLRHVAGFGAATALVGGWLPATGELAVTEIGRFSSARLVSPATGDHRTLVEGPLLALLDVSRDGRLALLRRGPRGARYLELLEVLTGDRRRLDPGLGEGTTDRACFTPNGMAVYARTDVGDDLARLVRLSLAPDPTASTGPALASTGGVFASTDDALITVAAREDAELEDFAVSVDGATIALLWNIAGGRSELELLDAFTGGRSPIAPTPGDVVSSCSFSADGGTVALCAEGPASPSAVFRIELFPSGGEPGATPAGGWHASGVIARPPVIVPELHRFTSADGLPLTGWLYRPAGDGPHPMMISLHAGPEAQERPGFNPLFQDLVGRGVAVFAPNVRGSSGFGRAFVNADNRERRFGAIADVAACVGYLVDARIARPGRIGCMGRSYGGYLTLAALVTYPELFAVGVDVCGIADFATFYARTEPWIAAAAVGKYGCPDADRDLLRELSPLHRLDRLAAPLLVVHGANDTNVPLYEAEQVVEALAARGAPHRFLRFPDEGHEFLQRANRQRYVAETVAWVRDHLCPVDGGTGPEQRR